MVDLKHLAKQHFLHRIFLGCLERQQHASFDNQGFINFAMCRWPAL
jgi:hypothetical protein